MARIRSVKPEVRRSRTVTSWPRDVRLTWIYLWMYLDDEGRGEDDLALLKAELFPRDRDVTERKLDEWLWTITEKSGSPDKPPPLCRYVVDGLDFLHAVNWSEHQKISHPKPSVISPSTVHELRLSGLIRARDGSSLHHFASDSGGIPE
jgi:hypothetical protein